MYGLIAVSDCSDFQFSSKEFQYSIEMIRNQGVLDSSFQFFIEYCGHSKNTTLTFEPYFVAAHKNSVVLLNDVTYRNRT